MCDVMEFPEKIEDFLSDHSFKDAAEVYTNGAELIPVFRVKQALEHYEKKMKCKYWNAEYEDCTLNNSIIRNDAIDEFAERLKKKILEEIDDVSECQRNYEVGSDMSITCSHIMGSLRDVNHRVIDQIAEELKGGAK